MGTLTPLRFILAWRTYRVGETIEPNGTLRDWLIRSGYCVPVEQRMVKPQAQKMVARRKTR